MPPVVITVVAGLILEWTAQTMILMVALTLVSMLLAPSTSQAGQQLPTGQLQEFSGTVEPRRIVYGTNLLGGMNVIPPWCHGQSNEMLDQLIVLAGHICSALRDVWFNQGPVASNMIGAVIGSLNDGAITTGEFGNKVWARRYNGTQSQVDYILNDAWPGFWSTDHVGRGLAYIALQFKYDAEVYANGKPDVKVLVDGKIVYDPRLDTAPGADISNPAHRAFSSNPALCIVDYLLDAELGVGESPTRMDWVSVVAAANTCDELVTIPGNQTQKRYTCNVVLQSTDDYQTNLQVLAGAMQGAVLYSSGRWVLFPGKYLTPSFSITDDDVAGQLEFRTAIPYKDRWNAVRGQFYDPDNMYQPMEYSPARVETDEENDGELVWREMNIGTCTDTYEAQRNAMVEQRKSRRRKTWDVALNYGSYGIRPGEFGTISITELGLVNATVRCLGWKLDGATMSIQLSLAEVDSNDWNDPAPSTYATKGSIMGAAQASFVPAPISDLAAEGVAGGVNLTWNLPATWFNNLVVDIFESFTNSYGASTLKWSGVNTGVFLGSGDVRTRYYWVRVRNLGGPGRSVTVPGGGSGGVAATPLTASAGPPGAPGEGGISASLSLSVIALQADAVGHVSVYPPLIGRMRVFKGTEDVTAACTFTLAPDGNPDELAYTLNADGTYSITGGMPDAADQTTLTLRAVYAPSS